MRPAPSGSPAARRGQLGDELRSTAGSRYGGIDALRHLFAVWVIILHSWSASRYPSEMRQGYEALTEMVGGAVFGFFLITGFFLRPRDDFRRYSADKARRLIVPYLLFSAIYGVAAIVLHGQPVLPLFIKTLILSGTSMQLYFLPYLFLADVGAVALFSWVVVPSKLAVFGLLALATALALAFPTPHSTGPGPQLMVFYVVGLLAGMLIARGGAGISLALCGAATVLGVSVDPRFLDAGLVIVLFAIFRIFSGLFPPQLPGSGAVYLLHTPVLNFAVSTALLSIGIGSWWNLGTTVALTCVICVAFAVALVSYAPSLRKLLLE